MKKILKDRWFLLFLVTGLILRLVLSLLPGFKIDVDAWFAWAIRLSSEGFLNFYSDNIWTNYTPGYLYILRILGDLQKLFSINSEIFYLLLKIPAFLADIGLAFFVYKIISESFAINKARIAAGLILFNPALIFNSTIWGQIDSILALALLISIYFLNNKKIVHSSIFFGLALLIKPQAIAITPVFLFFLFKHFSIKNLVNLSLPAFLILTIFSVPFFGFASIQKLFELFSKMTGDYPYTSLFAYNLWGSIGFWIKDNQTFFSLTYQNLGYILYLTFWIVIALWHFLKKNLSIYSLAALATLSFYFLPTRVHERYLYPAIPFLIILITQFRSSILSLSTYYLFLIYFLNLYYVYLYYNYQYLKLPSEIYYPIIYNFLDSYGKQLSAFSTFFFFLITISLVKLSYVKKTPPA